MIFVIRLDLIKGDLVEVFALLNAILVVGIFFNAAGDIPVSCYAVTTYLTLMKQRISIYMSVCMLFVYFVNHSSDLLHTWQVFC